MTRKRNSFSTLPPLLPLKLDEVNCILINAHNVRLWGYEYLITDSVNAYWWVYVLLVPSLLFSSHLLFLCYIHSIRDPSPTPDMNIVAAVFAAYANARAFSCVYVCVCVCVHIAGVISSSPSERTDLRITFSLQCLLVCLYRIQLICLAHGLGYCIVLVLICRRIEMCVWLLDSLMSNACLYSCIQQSSIRQLSCCYCNSCCCRCRRHVCRCCSHAARFCYLTNETSGDLNLTKLDRICFYFLQRDI